MLFVSTLDSFKRSALSIRRKTRLYFVPPRNSIPMVIHVRYCEAMVYLL